MAVLHEHHSDTLYFHHSLDEKPDPQNFSMHAHEQLEVLFFISGQGNIYVEGNEYNLQPHDLIIMRSAEMHRMSIQTDTPYERLAFHFPITVFDFLDPERRLLRPFLERPLGQGNLYAASQYPDAHWDVALSRTQYVDSAETHAHLLAMLLAVLPELCDAFDRRSHQKVPVPGLASQIVNHVNDHLFEPLSIQSIAEKFYCSPSHIGRIFHHATGSSLWDYVLLKRLLAARARLQRGEPAGKTCISCGFKDYSSFFRAYKARFGYAPKFEKPTYENDASLRRSMAQSSSDRISQNDTHT